VKITIDTPGDFSGVVKNEVQEFNFERGAMTEHEFPPNAQPLHKTVSTPMS
jgi:hypothetical protein